MPNLFGPSKAQKQARKERLEMERRTFEAGVREAERRLTEFQRECEGSLYRDRQGERAIRRDLEADLGIARANLRDNLAASRKQTTR